jgi:putative membrane protein
MKKLLLLLSGVACLCACKPQEESSNAGAVGSQSESQTAAETKKEKPDMAAEDVTFMKDAARGSIAEVKMGELGLSNGESQPVKEFSRRLVDDHKKASLELEKMATRKGVILPDDLSSEQKAMLQHLSGLRGGEFDTAFQQHAVQDHQKDIEKFKTAAGKAKDPELRSLAEKTLPVLQQHLDLANQLDKTPTAATPQ